MSEFRCTSCPNPAAIVMAISPGTEPQRGDLLSAVAGIPLSLGEPVRCLCWDCFWARFGGEPVSKQTVQ